MYLFFDTETSGLPINWKAPASNTKNWPRLVQIAWLVFDKTGNQTDGHDFIIKPEGFKIPLSAVAVHGITHERAIAEGVPLGQVLIQFSEAINKATFMVAHNINFDAKVVGAEFIRNDIPNRLFQTPHLCTMKSSTNYCQIPGPYGFKWPSLSELFAKLFGTDFEEAHDATEDVQACAKCFFKLKEIGIIN